MLFIIARRFHRQQIQMNGSSENEEKINISLSRSEQLSVSVQVKKPAKQDVKAKRRKI
jgi:hypothetical protein